MPHLCVCALRHLFARALPWAGLLTVSTTLAWAMNVGVTAHQSAPTELYLQPLPLPTICTGYARR